MDTAQEDAKRYPLKVLFCDQCGLSQLSIVVFPETLFSNYAYRSGISKGYRDHCKQMAKDLGVKAGDFVIDIAGNDGTLLHEFQTLTGCKGLNVDPAINLVPVNEANGVRQFAVFWGKEAAAHLLNPSLHWPRANFVTATNVFAHVDDVKEFLTTAASVLAPGGSIVLEFPYLIDFIENNEFDTVYFEHLSYFSLRPMQYLCNELGLYISKYSHQDIHGGSIRIEIIKSNTKNFMLVHHIIPTIEKDYMNIETYRSWALKVRDVIFTFRAGIMRLCAEGYKIAAFAASAKGNTLLNAAGITSQIEFIIDETPGKVGKFSPGTHIPIVAPGNWEVDYIVVLSWNFFSEIQAKCREMGYKGKFILPLTFEICE